MNRKSVIKALIWSITLTMMFSFYLPLAPVLADSETGGTGNTYYLATNGNDSDDGTIDRPFATLNYAVSALVSGDTLIIRAGTYKGYFAVISKSDITIKSYNGEKVILQNGEYKAGYVGYVGTSSNITISGFTFTFDDAGVQGNLIFVDGSSGVKISDCELSRGEGGIVARQGTTGLEISNCIMHDFTWPYGSVLLYNTSASLIFNNVFYNSYFGVNTYGSGTTGNVIYNNTFHGNDVDIGGASIEGIPGGNIFRNNIFSSPIQNQDHDYTTPIDNFMTQLNNFDYNFYSMSGAVTNDGLTLQQLKDQGIETNGYTGDPKFLNPVTADFKIGSGSDCTGKGDPQYMPEYDILGQLRAGNPSVGAYAGVERTNYYVSSSGTDTNMGTDTAPFATVAHALSVMKPGDYLYIKAGSYDEAINISGLTGITVMNYQQDKPEINQQVTVEDGMNVCVSGLKLYGSVVIKGGQDIKVSGMDINGGQIIVVPGTSSTDNYEISSCLIHGFTGEGAILVYNGRNGNLSNNVIYNNAHQGILLEGGDCTNNKIFNNTLHGNGSDLCLVYANSIGNPGGNTFKNNIFSNGFEVGNDEFFTTNTFDYNCYDQAAMTEAIGYSNVYDADGNLTDTLYPALADLQAKGVEQNGFLGDPSFLNPGNDDFRLRANSGCIGRGTPDGAPAADILGFNRTSPYEIGAYVYTGVVNEYYVSVDGDDSNTGAVDAPFKTIQHAVDLMAPGETIYVKGGMYDQQIVINGKSGDPAGMYAIKPAPGETPVLSSGGKLDTAVTIGQGSGNWIIDGLKIQDYTGNGIEVKEQSDNITLSNLTVSDVGGNGIYIENSQNTKMENIQVSKTVDGIKMSEATGWTIDRSLSDKALGAAAALSASTGRITSSLFTNSNIGLETVDSSGLVLYNNDFYGNVESDLKIGQNTTGSAVKNNIFGSASSVYSLQIADLDNDLDYNCYNKATQDKSIYYTSAMGLDDFKDLGKEVNGINMDPMYTDPANGNFLLQAGSPCAGKGVKDANTPSAGYDGYSFEIPVDMGAVFSPFTLNEYYVAPNGDDSNDGSRANPWKTIKKGMTSLKPSDTLYICGGVYNERINVTGQNGRPYAYFTVKNFPGEEVIMNSNFSESVGIKYTDSSYWRIDGLKITEYVGAGIWVASGSKYITMENLEIWNIDNKEPHSSGTEGILGDGGTYSTVRNCYIHDISETLRADLDNGIYIGYGAHHWVFDSNRIDNVPGAGLQFYGKPGGGDDCVVINNVITNCKHGMILTMGYRNLISNNTLINNWEYDLYMDWWYNDSIIQNNIFYNDLPVGTKVKALDKELQVARDFEINPVSIAFLYDQVNGNIFRNNVIYNKYFGNRVVDYKTIKPLDDYLAVQTLNTFENVIKADPMFSDLSGGNFTMKSGSPCIDAGTADQAPTTDIRGVERKDNAPDIGAYEYEAANPADGGETPSTPATPPQSVQ